MKKILPLALLILIFLAIKIANNGIRLSDTNIYFNIAYQVSNGSVLYKDIFFSNFPFFSYVSSLYYFLSGTNINFFYFTSSLEVSIITFLIYQITYRKTKNYLISILSSVIYTLSFMVLSTSDHQTGIFTASLLAILSYYFLQKEKIIISGIFMALAIFTKAYFLPIFISFFLYIALKKEWKKLLKFGISFTLTGLIILLPFLIQAPKQLISDIFGFSLTRPAGLSKINIAWFFMSKEILLFAILIFNIFNIRKNILFGLISITSITFFLGYQDVYYLYLNFLTPFLCLSFYEVYFFLKNSFNLQRLVIPTIIVVFILINLTTYLSSYKDLGRVKDFDKIIATIISEKPDYLYGANDIAPAIISLTKIPALENVNDAHEYFFIRKIYDKNILTDKAIKNKTIIVTHGANYPEYNIKQDILDNIFVKEAIYENCKNILSIPVQSEGSANRINLFKCY
ncbi:MAG: glycosyltransferase family 39 protein [Candidatus Levybacteria bacterium]|nr:glycosyltransferase family 39 protein [Candidatus Levybacteria bacterium]